MRKKLSLVLALLLVFGLVPKADASSSPFSDVPTSHWAYDAILEAYEKYRQQYHCSPRSSQRG